MPLTLRRKILEKAATTVTEKKDMKNDEKGNSHDTFGSVSKRKAPNEGLLAFESKSWSMLEGSKVKPFFFF